MDQVHVIRHMVLVEGRSIRKTAKDLGVSRNTVRRYLKASEPIREEPRRRVRPVSDAVAPKIEQILDDWDARSTRKQRVTGTRLHRELRKQEFEVGLTTVRAYLREKRRQEAEVYIPLVYRPGEVAQVDFFEVTVEVEGRRLKAWMFLIYLMYSGRTFARLYERCDQVSFLDGHVRAFAHLGAIPWRLVYDNLTPAVKKIIRGDRDLTGRFQALVSHYLFEPCFARPGEGHDKGGVEGRGKGVRLAHLVPIPRGSSLDAISLVLQADLDQECQWKRDAAGRTVAERFDQEAQRMRPLPTRPFDPSRVVCVRISSSAKVQIEGAWYSVPSTWASQDATAYVGVDSIRLSWREEETVCERARKGDKQIRNRHYLPELARKPQAVRQVAPELIRELGKPYDQLWPYCSKTRSRLTSQRLYRSTAPGSSLVESGLARRISECAGSYSHGNSLSRSSLAGSTSTSRRRLIICARRIESSRSSSAGSDSGSPTTSDGGSRPRARRSAGKP
jgi:transposase